MNQYTTTDMNLIYPGLRRYAFKTQKWWSSQLRQFDRVPSDPVQGGRKERVEQTNEPGLMPWGEHSAVSPSQR